MVVFVLDTASEKLRGILTQWCLELKPGVFVGRIKASVREKIWSLIEESNSHSGSIMVWQSNTEQGFDMKMTGIPYRKIIEFDGLKLIIRDPKEKTT